MYTDDSNAKYSVSAYIRAQQTIFKKIINDGQLHINTPEINNIYSESGKTTFYSIGARRSFLKEDRLTISLSAINFTSRYKNYKTSTDAPGYSSHSDIKYRGRQFGISLSYRFGTLKAQVKKARTPITNDDLQGRK